MNEAGKPNTVVPYFLLLLSIYIIFYGPLKASAEVDLTGGLVAYYPFEGNANDASGNNHDGVVTGAILTEDRKGVANSAYEFDGNDFIVVPEDSETFNIPENGFTIAFWAKVDTSQQTSSLPAFAGYGGYSSNGWDVYGYGTDVAISLRTSTSEKCSNYLSIENNQNEWFHYVASYENGTVTIYKNGRLMTESQCSNYYLSSGYNFVIGASSRYSNGEGGVVGKIDDVRVYHKALSPLEVAHLSENETAIEVATKGTVFHSNFEDGTLDPEQLSYALDLHGVADDAVRVVPNPDKDEINTSDFVMIAGTVPSAEGEYTRAEYRTPWMEPFETNQKKHIYQWMVYFPEEYMVDIDQLGGGGNWHIITQFVTHPCAWNSSVDGFTQFQDGRVCGSGGIFNEIRIDPENHDTYNFEYRADPDCNSIAYDYPRGEWIKLTYEIVWSTESTGSYAVWANEQLLDEMENVQTLPRGFVDGTCDIRWKVGLYDSWSDSEVESIYYYLDNLELYIDKDMTTICPGCLKTPVTGDIDGDGTVDLRDVISGLRIVSGSTVDIVNPGTLTDDKVIDLSEVIYNMQLISNRNLSSARD